MAGIFSASIRPFFKNKHKGVDKNLQKHFKNRANSRLVTRNDIEIAAESGAMAHDGFQEPGVSERSFTGIKSQEYNSYGTHMQPEQHFTEILIFGYHNPVIFICQRQDDGISTSRHRFVNAQHVMSGFPKNRYDRSLAALAHKKLHQGRPSAVIVSSPARQSAANASDSWISSTVIEGYCSRISWCDIPSDSFLNKTSTVIRVPFITGFPIITPGVI
jgi:hypothetical protein